MSGVDLRRASILRRQRPPARPFQQLIPPLPYRRKPLLAPATIIPTPDQHNNVGPVSALGRLPHHQISRLVMLQHATGQNLLTTLTSSGHLLILTTCCAEFTQQRQLIYLVQTKRAPPLQLPVPFTRPAIEGASDTVQNEMATHHRPPLCDAFSGGNGLGEAQQASVCPS